MISSNEFRPGTTIEYKDEVWQVIEANHVKPGKGSAFVQTKLKNLARGDILRVNFRAGERVQDADVDKMEMHYSYRDGEIYVLMDAMGIEMVELEKCQIGPNVEFMKEGLGGITVLRYRGKILRIHLPNTVELSVQQAPPDERGDTSGSGGKQAVLETGAVIIVPFHIKIGDKILVDTRSREYLARK